METHKIPAMERLIQWLPLHFPESQKTTLVHGDFRYCPGAHPRQDECKMTPKLQKVLIGLGSSFRAAQKLGFGSGSASPGNEIEFLHPAAANAGVTLEDHQLFLQYSGISPDLRL